MLAGVVIVLFIMGGVLVSNLLKPPFTLGKTQEKVILDFYNGYNTLNHEAMSKSVARGVGKNEIKRVFDFYTVSKVQRKMGGPSFHVKVESFAKSGIKASQFTSVIWGFADIELTRRSDMRFSVEYKYWELENTIVNGLEKALNIGYLEQVIIELDKRVFKYGPEDAEYYVISSMETEFTRKL